jgi:hypothetical protein
MSYMLVTLVILVIGECKSQPKTSITMVKYDLKNSYDKSPEKSTEEDSSSQSHFKTRLTDSPIHVQSKIINFVNKNTQIKKRESKEVTKALTYFQPTQYPFYNPYNMYLQGQTPV